MVIIASATRVTPKLEEYITPEKVFLYTKKMKRPIAKERRSAIAMSIKFTLVTLLRKLDLKMSEKFVVCCAVGIVFSPKKILKFVFDVEGERRGVGRRGERGRTGRFFEN